MQHLLDAGVASRRGIMCTHREPAYADLPCRFPLPHSDAAQEQCIILPLYVQMKEEDQELVALTLAGACQKAMVAA